MTLELRHVTKRVRNQTHIDDVSLTFEHGTLNILLGPTLSVMYEGEVVQIGTPEELFERPAHTFVGYFIGSPGMNVVPVKVEGDRAQLGSQELRLGKAYPRLAPGVRTEIGIRPEFVNVGASSGLRARVLKVDDVGRYRVVRTEIDGHAFNAIAGEDARIDGDETLVSFDRSKIHIYANSRRIDGEPVMAGAS